MYLYILVATFFAIGSLMYLCNLFATFLAIGLSVNELFYAFKNKRRISNKYQLNVVVRFFVNSGLQ